MKKLKEEILIRNQLSTFSSKGNSRPSTHFSTGNLKSFTSFSTDNPTSSDIYL